MKNRLQNLWDEVTPDCGPCPKPDVKKVRRRVDAALDNKHHIVPRRALRLAMVVTAVMLSLTSIALASGVLIPPEYNVLSTMFGRGTNPETAIAMMTITPMSVEDDNYTMTVTSSLADGNKVYFTLLIDPKNDQARERLENAEWGDLLSLRIFGSDSYGISGEIAPVDGVWHLAVSATWKAGKNASVRLNTMDEGIWLTFPVKPVRSITVEINAEGQGRGDGHHASGGPVTLKTVEVSPLSFKLDFTSPYADMGVPVVAFLWKDGIIQTAGQMDAVSHSGHGGPDSLFGSSETYRGQYSYKFPFVQDLSLLEAVVFEGMAYPLGGGDPYEVDVSGIPRPFAIPAGELLDGYDPSVPLFALCEGLGADLAWDEETGVATATFRGVPVTFTVGSKAVQCEAIPQGWNAHSMDAAAVYQDGELWLDASGYGLFNIAWGVELEAATDDWENRQVREDHSVVFTSWVVIP